MSTHTHVGRARREGRVWTAVVVALLAGLNTGCSTSTPSNLAVVLGIHSNFVGITDVSAVADDVRRIASHGGRLVVVLADGRPRVTYSDQVTAPSNDLEKDQLFGRLIGAIREQAKTVRPQAAEVDQLAALALAARSLRGTRGDHSIAVFDSMLQTSGALPMQSGLLNKPPASVADELAKSKQLPDLSGMQVELFGIGQASSPQEPLPISAQRALEDLWTDIVKRSGGTPLIGAQLPAATLASGLLPVSVVRVDAVPVTGAGPAASPVPVTGAGPAASPVPPARTTPVRPAAPAPHAGVGTRVVLRESELGFLPDQAAFREPSRVTSVLRPFAEALAASPGKLRVTLAGTTSSHGSEAGRLKLSTARAEAVREVLVRLGAPRTHIKAVGVGTHFADFVPDRDARGKLDPARAERNRTVILQLISE